MQVRKTANEYYLVAAGLPDPDLLPLAHDRAAAIAGFGFAMINIMSVINLQLRDARQPGLAQALRGAQFTVQVTRLECDRHLRLVVSGIWRLLIRPRIPLPVFPRHLAPAWIEWGHQLDRLPLKSRAPQKVHFFLFPIGGHRLRVCHRWRYRP